MNYMDTGCSPFYRTAYYLGSYIAWWASIGDGHECFYGGDKSLWVEMADAKYSHSYLLV